MAESQVNSLQEFLELPLIQLHELGPMLRGTGCDELADLALLDQSDLVVICGVEKGVLQKKLRALIESLQSELQRR